MFCINVYKIITNESKQNQYIKVLMYHDQIEIILGNQGQLNFPNHVIYQTNIIKIKHFHLYWYEKHFSKSFHDKSTN